MTSALATAGPLTIAAAALVSAALHDIAFRTVPNWIAAVLLAAGIVLRAMTGSMLPGLLAGSLVFTGAALCWRRGWLGGGDVKLLAAAAVVAPPPMTVNLLLDIALAGGLLSGIYLLLQRLMTRPAQPARRGGWLRRISRVEQYRIRRRGPVPYASAIAAGTVFILLKG